MTGFRRSCKNHRTILFILVSWACIEGVGTAQLSVPLDLERDFPQWKVLPEREQAELFGPVEEARIRALQATQADVHEASIDYEHYSRVARIRVSGRDLGRQYLDAVGFNRAAALFEHATSIDLRARSAWKVRLSLAEYVCSNALEMQAMSSRAGYERALMVLLVQDDHDRAAALFAEAALIGAEGDQMKSRSRAAAAALAEPKHSADFQESRWIMDELRRAKAWSQIRGVAYGALRGYEAAGSQGILPPAFDGSAAPFATVAQAAAEVGARSVSEELDALLPELEGSSPDDWAAAHFWVANRWRIDGYHGEAERRYRAVVARGHLNKYSALASLGVAEMRYAQRDLDEAAVNFLDTIETYGELFPEVREQASVRLAQMEEAGLIDLVAVDAVRKGKGRSPVQTSLNAGASTGSNSEVRK